MSKQRILGDLAHNLDSSAIGSFLAKSSAGGDFQTVDYSSITGTPSVVLDSSLTSQLIDSSYIQLRETPSTSGIDSATALNLIDSSYLSNINGTNTGFAEFYYNATAGQTIFDSDLRGRNLSYTEGGVMVFLNGVMLAPAQYTATDGTTVVLDSGASLSDEITVVKFGLGSSGGGGGASFDWGGDRALCAGGNVSGTNLSSIDYFDITTPGNAQDFGDLGASHNGGGSASNKTRGVIAGEENSNRSDRIEYLTIASTGNATDFGNLSVGRNALAGVSDGTYGVFLGGSNISNSLVNTIDYITIASTGNATDFGDTNQAMNEMGAGNDATRGVIADNDVNWEMQYVTIATPGNTTDFGDMSVGRYGSAKGIDDGTYIVFAGGLNGGVSNVMDYITVQTTGNSSDFGDLLAGYLYPDGASNGTRGVVTAGYTSSGTNTIQYITIATPGNATDFGDTEQWTNSAGASGSPS